MKKTLVFLLALSLMAGLLTGCAQPTGGDADLSTAATDNVFTADNEIFTYQRIDPDRTQIVISRTGNIFVEDMCREFEAQNPDVQVIYLDITGGSSAYKPLIDWVTRGYRPDVVIAGAQFFNEELTAECFENLSRDPILQKYQAAALQRTATRDEIYWLPGPSNISAMMYNKTLFDQYGWQVPATFDEFVALCDQIREDTDGAVEPWNPNAKYDRELLTAIEAITYAQLLGGADNRAWYKALINEEASFNGHMMPYAETLQTLADHGILREEHFSYSATTRGQEFAAGLIAMVNANIDDVNSDKFDFSYMPFPTTQGELGYVCDSYSCFVGLPVKDHTEQEQDAIDRFVAFFSSAQGQQCYIGDAMMVSNVRDVPLDQSDDLLGLQPAIEAGHMFEVLDFHSVSGKQANFNLRQMALDIASGARTAEECLAIADAPAYTDDPAPVTVPQVLATASQDLTVLETSFRIADMYREIAGADIGLIAHNEPYRGNMMRVFAGDITSDLVAVLKPRSFANDSALVKVAMTGRQLLDALNAPVGNDSVSNGVYAYSGLRCQVAPWNQQGSRYLSVKLADGTELDTERLYTVAAWSGTIADGYITEVLETYAGSWEELMTAWLLSGGPMTPATDGRIQLIWY